MKNESNMSSFGRDRWFYHQYRFVSGHTYLYGARQYMAKVVAKRPLLPVGEFEFSLHPALEVVTQHMHVKRYVYRHVYRHVYRCMYRWSATACVWDS